MGSTIVIFILGAALLLLVGLIMLIVRIFVKKQNRILSILLLVFGLLNMFPAGCITVIGVRDAVTRAVEKREEMGALLSAIDQNHLGKVKVLLTSQNVNEKRVLSEYSSHLYFTPLSFACKKNATEIAAYLISHGADVNKNFIYPANGLESTTPLMYAVSNNNYELVKLLTDNGADINQGSSFDNPVSLALENGELKMIKHLLELGADPDLARIDKEDTMIGIISVRNPRVEILKYLYESRIDRSVNTVTLGNPPLIKAMIASSPREFILQLLEYGADPGIIGDFGNTAMHAAAKSNDLFMVNYLQSFGFDINRQDHFGRTPFFEAATSGYDSDDELRDKLEIIKLFLKQGADPEILNSDGLSYVEYNKTRGREELNELILKLL